MTRHYVLPFLLLSQGEALRQILVNRYYGNFHRSGGRRESLASFTNGPLSPVGPTKHQSGRTHFQLTVNTKHQMPSSMKTLISTSVAEVMFL